MKKALSHLLLISLIITLSGCSTEPETTTQTETTPPPPPFNFETETTEGDIAYLTESEDLITLLGTTPYHIGEKTLSVPAIHDFDALKKSKIQEAQRLTNDQYENLLKLETELVPFKIALHKFISDAYDEEPKIEEFAQEVAGQFLEYNIKEGLVKTRINVANERKPENDYTDSFIEYDKTSQVILLTETFYEDLGFLISNAAQLASAFADTDNQKLKTSLADLESQMEKIDNLNDSLTTINQTNADIDVALKQIETADYYMGLASLSFIQESLPDIKNKIDSIDRPDQLSADDQEFIREYAILIEDFTDDMAEVMANTDTSNLLLEESPPPAALVPLARAGFTDFLSSAYNGLSAAASGAADATRLAWRGTKNAIGVGIDTLDAGAASLFDAGFTLYDGDSISDLGSRIYSNFANIKDNYNKGASGAKVLKTANEYLENAENIPDKFTADFVAEYTGEGWTSWLAGKTVKLTAGLFTQFGKGITKMANTQSTTGEFVEGLVDVGFSFIGGSQVIAKGTQVLKGGATTLKQFGSKGVNFLKNTWNKASLANLRTLYDDAVKAGGDAASAYLEEITNKIATREALKETLENIGKQIDEDIIATVKEGAETVLENLTKSAKGSYDDFVNKMYTSENLTDFVLNVKQAIDDAAGTTARDYIDNLIGNVIDDEIKAVVKGIVENTFGKFGGTYSGNAVVEGYSFPIVMEVSGPVMTGVLATTIEVDFFEEPIVIKVGAEMSGTINESAGVVGSLTGSASAEGETTPFTGRFEGTITETTMNLPNITIIAEGETYPFKVVLTKVGT